MRTRRWSPRAGGPTGASSARSARCRPHSADGVSVYCAPGPRQRRRAGADRRGAGAPARADRAGGLLVCDSACGHPKTLAQIAAAGLRFVVPLGATSGSASASWPTSATSAAAARLRRRARAPPAADAAHPLPRRAARLAAHRPRPPASRSATRRLHPLQRRSARGRRRPRTRAREGRARARARPARTRRPLLQDQAQVDARSPRSSPATRRPADRHDRHPPGRPTLAYHRDEQAITAAATTDGIYALATNLPGRLSADHVLRALQRPADRRAPPPRRQADAQSPPDLPAQRRPHPRPVSLVGIALLIFGLIETQSATPQRRPTPRPAARRPRRHTHRPQHPRRLPRPRPHLHPTTASASTASPPPNAASSTCSSPATLARAGQVTVTNRGKRG